MLFVRSSLACLFLVLGSVQWSRAESELPVVDIGRKELQHCGVESLSHRTADEIWLVDGCDVHVSHDAGRTWTEHHEDRLDDAWTLAWPTPNFGVAGNYSGPTWVTRDGGHTWSRSPHWGSELVTWAGHRTWVHETDELAYTDDDGRSWESVLADDAELDCEALVFLDEHDGWCLSYFDLLVTEDAGRTWSHRNDHAPGERLVRLDAERAWIYDSPDYEHVSCWETTDGGRSWKMRGHLPPPSERQARLKTYTTGRGVRELLVTELIEGAEGASSVVPLPPRIDVVHSGKGMVTLIGDEQVEIRDGEHVVFRGTPSIVEDESLVALDRRLDDRFGRSWGFAKEDLLLFDESLGEWLVVDWLQGEDEEVEPFEELAWLTEVHGLALGARGGVHSCTSSGRSFELSKQPVLDRWKLHRQLHLESPGHALPPHPLELLARQPEGRLEIHDLGSTRCRSLQHRLVLTWDEKGGTLEARPDLSGIESEQVALRPDSVRHWLDRIALLARAEDADDPGRVGPLLAWTTPDSDGGQVDTRGKLGARALPLEFHACHEGHPLTLIGCAMGRTHLAWPSVDPGYEETPLQTKRITNCVFDSGESVSVRFNDLGIELDPALLSSSQLVEAP
ncbi:MAG: hypothetical protein AAF533_00840 [Acidobacteriota bacterium]